MWQELVLLHREGSRASLEGEGARWRTCLREILFLEPGQEPRAGAQAYRGIQAHRFLLEVCSGLRSPLFGETEILGQFRSFREEERFHHLWEPLFEAVEEDARKLRRTLLLGMGSQSYGSLARRHLEKNSKVVLVGAGQLARELLPWLKGSTVTVAARRLEAAEALGMGALPLTALGEHLPSLEGASWLLAAPVANEELLRWWATNPATLALDFRGESRFASPPPGCARYLGLQDLFQEIEGAKLQHERRRAEALAYAHELSGRREQAVLHRPFGWEDTFA